MYFFRFVRFLINLFFARKPINREISDVAANDDESSVIDVNWDLVLGEVWPVERYIWFLINEQTGTECCIEPGFNSFLDERVALKYVLIPHELRLYVYSGTFVVNSVNLRVHGSEEGCVSVSLNPGDSFGRTGTMFRVIQVNSPEFDSWYSSNYDRLDADRRSRLYQWFD